MPMHKLLARLHQHSLNIMMPHKPKLQREMLKKKLKMNWKSQQLSRTITSIRLVVSHRKIQRELIASSLTWCWQKRDWWISWIWPWTSQWIGSSKKSKFTTQNVSKKERLCKIRALRNSMRTSESNGLVREDSKWRFTKRESLKLPTTTVSMRDRWGHVSKSTMA